MNHEEQVRTARHLALPGFTAESQRRLHHSHVLIVGAGGLGCPIMQSLAAVGVGTMTIIDDDTVSLSNLHRQILFGVADCGQPKVDVAARRLREIQPSITLHCRNERLTEDNAIDLVRGVDLVIDGSDTFATKYLCADACEITHTPLVWGSVLRYAGQVALWADGVSLRDLFPDQPDTASVPDCATAGVLGVTTAVVGSLMATEATKFLAHLDGVIPGRVQLYDALAATLRHVTVTADPHRDRVTHLGTYAQTCSIPRAQELFALVESGEATAVDIREDHERLAEDFAWTTPSLHLPLSTLTPADLAQLSGTAVIYCASGQRSDRLVADYPDTTATLLSLPGGIRGNPTLPRRT